jgi:hypothetical protein
LYSAPSGNGESSTVGFQLPDIFQTVGNESGPNFEFSLSKRNETAAPKQNRIHEVTKRLISIYKGKRMEVFHKMARTRAALRSKEFFRIYTSPSECIINGKSQRLRKYKTKFHKSKEKKFSYQIEYERLRGLRESEEELAKVQAYIDKMIAKNIKKLEEEKRKKNLVPAKSDEDQYTTLSALVSLKIN